MTVLKGGGEWLIMKYSWTVALMWSLWPVVNSSLDQQFGIL